MPALTVTPDPAATPPRARLALSGFAAGQVVHVSRQDPDGRLRPVRRAEPITVNATGAESVDDVEMPYGARVTYSAAGATSVSTTVASPVGWAVAPGDPGASVPLSFILDRDGETFESGTTLVRVLGRREPVPVTNVVRTSAQSGITFRTTTRAESDRVRDLLAGSPVLLLNIPPYGGVAETWHYVVPGTVSMDYVVRGVYPDRVWSFDYTVVERPVGGLRPQWTVGRLLEEVPNVGALKQLYRTVADLRTNTRRPL